MTDKPEIPDSISPEMLDGLLRNRNPLPISDVIPSIDFGGSVGAPCDLQFALSQLIERSARGTSILQMLVTSLYLITEIEGHFDQHLELVMREDPPYTDVPAADQKQIARCMRSYLMGLRIASQQLEELLAVIGYPYYQERAKQLIETEFKGRPRSLPDFRSHMMISSELLDSLQIDRASVTTYLDNIQSKP